MPTAARDRIFAGCFCYPFSKNETNRFDFGTQWVLHPNVCWTLNSQECFKANLKTIALASPKHNPSGFRQKQQATAENKNDDAKTACTKCCQLEIAGHPTTSFEQAIKNSQSKAMAWGGWPRTLGPGIYTRQLESPESIGQASANHKKNKGKAP